MHKRAELPNPPSRKCRTRRVEPSTLVQDRFKTRPMIASRFAFTLALGLAAAAPALAGTSLVVDANSGEVLSSENPSQAWHPASTTKMMTIYLALKAVREGRLGLETAIPASKLAASQPRVKVYIKPGQEITLDNALRIMMVKSANDIAYVVAEGVGGDVPTFVSMMNAEAQRLGMRDTHFTNPNGWHDPNQQVSARDLAVLAMALMHDFPEYAGYWNIGALQLGRQIIHNTNGLVGRYSGITGMKTGFTCPSGFNVVAVANRGGRTLIAIVLGAASGTERTVKAAQLLDDGFSKWGGSGYTIASLPSGSGGRAYSVCDDIRRRGGGAPLADDAESAGPITSAAVQAVGGNAEGTSDRFPIAGAQPAATGAMLSRSSSGRISLGPRAQVAPIPVAFGRSPGSATAPLAANVANRADTQVARGAVPTIAPGAPVAAGLFASPSARTPSSNGSISGTTRAFAPTGAAEDNQQPQTNGTADRGPLRLQGAIQPGAATATSLRPGAAAGIKQAARSPARPLLAKPEASKAKADGKAKAESKAKPSHAAAKPPAKPAAKPAPKPKAKPNTDA
ncbi:D-alanyl-D-alanine carboxypeptidase [Bosea sp. BK604]|nr:D-alanyl-D-alanine carboxypeptidase [Bosea sp. BK604]